MCSSCCCPSPPPLVPQPVFGSLLGDPNNFTVVTSGDNLNFLTAGPTSGMVSDPATDSITITTFGVYEINFSLTNQYNNSSGGLQYSLFINNAEIPTSRIFFQITTPAGVIRNPGAKTILITLNPNDLIQVRPTILGGGTFSYGNPSLIVTKIL